MTSIRCPECSTEVSGLEHTCPSCNFPISKLRGLSAAILTKNVERVAGLIQLGADVNAVDKNGRTPLMIAALIDDADIVEMLLAAGAKAEFVNQASETALSIAKSKEVERLIRRAIVVSRFNSAQKSAQPETSEDPPQRQKEEQPIEPTLKFDDSLMFTEDSPWENRNNEVAAIDVQLNEELFESLHTHKVPEELWPEPKLDFDDFTEVAAWENRDSQAASIDVQLNEEIFETAETPKIDEEPLPEPVLDFDQSLKLTEVAAWENRINPISETAAILETETQVNEETVGKFDDPLMIMEVPQLHYNEAPLIDVQLNEPQSEWSIKEKPAPKFTDPLLLIVASEWDNRIVDAGDTIKISRLYKTATIDIQEPIEVQQPPENFVQPEFRRAKGPLYFVAAMIGCCLLILFMVLTWPRSSESPIPQAIRSLKPVNQIIKTESEKDLSFQKNEIVVDEETKPVDPIPKPEVQKQIITSSPKEESKPVIKRASTLGNEQKIRLGRALNNQGYALIKQGRPGEAIPVLEKSLRSFPKGTKDPHYAYALFNLGVAWRKAGRPDLAIPILEKRIQIDNQRDMVARELNIARQQAKSAGFDTFQK